MNYDQTIDFIHSTYKFGSKLGLENITKLTELLGNPQDSYKIIHVAGTNGKGSTCNMIHDVLVACGYKTGLYISPFLEQFNERIQINKVSIDNDSLARIASLVKDKIDIMLSEGLNHPTEFEIVTAIGLKYFEEQQIDFLVLEVGLGGRFDATNVISQSLVSVIASISYDHMQYLGDTLESIAFEKSGIIKNSGHVVIYPQASNITDVIKEQSKLKNASVYDVDMDNVEMISTDLSCQKFKYLKTDVFNLPEVTLHLLGKHQIYNCITALRAIEVIKSFGYDINEGNILKGLEFCFFAGRFEIVHQNPLIILDGGHNLGGVEYFAKTITDYVKGKKIILFYGMLEDKNPEFVVDCLIDISQKIYTLTPDNPRAMTAEAMAKLIKAHSDDIDVTPIPDTNDIVPVLENIITNGKDEIVAFVGSLYMIGRVRTILRNSGFFEGSN